MPLAKCNPQSCNLPGRFKKIRPSRAVGREEETELRKISKSIVVKDVRSPERLLDETALFLHRVQSKLPE
jgi:hypothetical protein